MTRTKLKKRIAYWQDKMGLGSWEVFLSAIEPEHDALAETDFDVKFRQAAMRFWRKTPENQYDRLIVHELTHCLLAEIQDLFDRSVNDHQAEAQALLRQQWVQSAEFICERMATAFTGQARAEFGDEVPEVWKHVELCR